MVKLIERTNKLLVNNSRLVSNVPDCVLHLKLESDGSDSAKYGYDFTEYLTPSYVNAKLNKGVQLSGLLSSDYLYRSYTPNEYINFIPTQPMSYECWFYMNNLPSDDGHNYTVYDVGYYYIEDMENSNGFSLWIRDNDDCFYLSNTANDYFVVGSTPLSKHKWYHLVCVFNGDKSGRLVIRDTDGNYLANEIFSDETFITATYAAFLGAAYEQSYGNYQEQLNGIIDNFRIFKSALTPVGINALYYDGAGTEETHYG